MGRTLFDFKKIWVRLTGVTFIGVLLVLIVPVIISVFDRSKLNGIEPLLTEHRVQGKPIVTDGDTLKFIIGDKTVRVRMQGIDAPESKQQCMRLGKIYECGLDSTQALQSYIGDDGVFCESEGYDRYGRMIGVCAVYKKGAPHDLGAYMVENGHALAYRYYTERYVSQENDARTDKKGIWSGAFVPPYEWRKGKRLQP